MHNHSLVVILKEFDWLDWLDWLDGYYQSIPSHGHPSRRRHQVLECQCHSHHRTTKESKDSNDDDDNNVVGEEEEWVPFTITIAIETNEAFSMVVVPLVVPYSSNDDHPSSPPLGVFG